MSGRPIVHLAPFLQGGAGRAIAMLAVAQRRGGNDVIVATSVTAEPGFENYPEYLSAITGSGATLITVDSLFKRDAMLNTTARDAVMRALAGRTPAIIHAHAAIAARIGLQLGAPVIQTMHGWSRGKSAAHAAEDLSIMRSVDVVAFPSASAHRELIDAGGEFRQIAIVPNGIDATPVCDPLPAALADLPGLRAQGTRVLVTIGSLTAQKNHAVLIRALATLPGRDHLLLACVGEGPEAQPLVELARSLGIDDRVRMIGYLPRAASVLQAADLLIQPSLTESFGLAVLEAFRSGVPVVASHIPALRELVDDTRGLVFDPHSSDDLRGALQRALSMTATARTRMIHSARSLFIDRFTDDRMIAAYDAIYGEMTTQATRG